MMEKVLIKIPLKLYANLEPNWIRIKTQKNKKILSC